MEQLLQAIRDAIERLIMALQSFNIQSPPKINGDIDTTQPVPTPDVTWATVPDFLNQLEGTAFSHDVRQYASGTGAATATLTIVDVSGDTAATLGLTIQTADFLDTAAGTVGAGTYQINAAYSGQNFRSNVFSFSVVAVSGSDTLAPTEPLLSIWTASSSTQVDLTIIPPCDPKSPASDATGMASVEIHRNEDGGAYSLLTTKSMSAGISLQLLAQTIGTVNETPGHTQTGPDYELTAAGLAGVDGPSDQLFFLAASHSGDFDITAKIPSFSAPASSKTQAHLLCRETLGATSKYFGVGRLSNATSSPDPKYVEAKWRVTLGGPIAWQNVKNDLTGDLYVWLKRAGNVFTGRWWQVGNPQWVVVKQQTIVMNTNVFVGVSLSSGLANTEATVDFEEVSIQNVAAITHSDTGLTEDVLYGYKLKGVSA